MDESSAEVAGYASDGESVGAGGHSCAEKYSSEYAVESSVEACDAARSDGANGSARSSDYASGDGVAGSSVALGVVAGSV